MLVRVFWQPGRFGASRPVGRFMFPLAYSLPFLTGKGAVGPTSPRKDTSDPFDGRSCGVGPLSLVGSDAGQLAPRPPTLALLVLWSRGRDGSCLRQP